MPVELSIHQLRFREVMRAMKAEAGGRLLRAEFRTEIKAILAPAVDEVRQGVLNWAVPGGPAHHGLPLRQAVAAGIKVGIASSGRATGARVYASKKGMPRNFANAPRDLNRESWEHPGGHGGPMITQVGVPAFFDRPLRARAGEFRAAILAATERMAERIAHA